MQPPHTSPARAKIIALMLLGALLVVAVLWRLGVYDTIVYGLAGGLVACRLIVGRDRLLSAERRLGERNDQHHQPPRDDPS